MIVLTLLGGVLGMVGSPLLLGGDLSDWSQVDVVVVLWAMPQLPLCVGFLGALAGATVGCLAAAWLEKWLGK